MNIEVRASDVLKGIGLYVAMIAGCLAIVWLADRAVKAWWL